MEYGVNLAEIWPIPRSFNGYKARKRCQKLLKEFAKTQSTNENVQQVENAIGRFAWDENDGLSKELGPAKVFKDGSSYIGQYDKRGNRSGRGIYIFSNGIKYEESVQRKLGIIS